MNPDAESLDWNLLDKDLRKNLDTYHYFSLSGKAKRTEDNPAESGTSGATQDPGTSDGGPEIDHTSLEVESDDDSADQIDIPEGSLFDYHVPGVLTKEEVEKLDLNTWKVQLRNGFVDMEDFKGWETSEMTDPQSIKGIVAELAAALGPEVVRGGSAVNLFYN